jgi:AcrR family transcriptional regulator
MKIAPAVSHANPTSGTPSELLDIAERLFAERGVDNVPLTEIVTASGQKNRSALHYHFGSREGVLTAVLNRRLAPINARREAALDALPPAPTVALIIRATMRALVEVVEAEPWGADYIAILAQVMFHPKLLGRRAVDDALLTGVRRSRRLVCQAAPDLTAKLIRRRLDWLNETVVFALARWVRDTPPEARSKIAGDGLIGQLTAYGAAALTAPPSNTGNAT